MGYLIEKTAIDQDYDRFFRKIAEATSGLVEEPYIGFERDLLAYVLADKAIWDVLIENMIIKMGEKKAQDAALKLHNYLFDKNRSKTDARMNRRAYEYIFVKLKKIVGQSRD